MTAYSDRLASLLFAVALTATAATPALAAGACPARPRFDYLGARIYETPRHAQGQRAYLYLTDDKIIDADGAPNAYHPGDRAHGEHCPDHGHGLDCLASAGYPTSDWWRTVLVTDPADDTTPIVQSDGAFAGYYVSMTTLRNTAFAGATSPQSYVDAANIPYVVLPAPIYRTGGMGDMGDIGYAINLANGRSTPFVIADEGPVEPLGEASVAFWRALGSDDPNPRNGEGLTDGTVAFMVFPHSRGTVHIGWPIDPARLASEANRLIAGFGGQVALQACLGVMHRPAPAPLERAR